MKGEKTKYKDKYGETISIGDKLCCYVSSEWDEEVPRREEAIVAYGQGRLWAKSCMTADWHELDEFNWEIVK